MNKREKNHFEKSAEIEKLIPHTRDLIILDGRFAQYGGKLPSGNHAVRFIEDNLKIIIDADDWDKYVYEKPAEGIFLARHLVEQGLMTKEQLEKVFWGSEEKEYPYLKGEVAFFGSYKRKE